MEPVGASTPPADPAELGVPVLVPPALVVPAPLVVPVAGVVVTGVVVAGVVEVDTEVVDPRPVAPVPALEDEEPLAESGVLSSALFVRTGVIAGGLEGTLSRIVEPPHAASARAPAPAPITASDRLARVTYSPPERTHATPAGWAVVQVALGQLLAPGAEAQVLNRPRKR